MKPTMPPTRPHSRGVAQSSIRPDGTPLRPWVPPHVPSTSRSPPRVSKRDQHATASRSQMLRSGDGGRSQLFLIHEQHRRRTRRPASEWRFQGHHGSLLALTALVKGHDHRTAYAAAGGRPRPGRRPSLHRLPEPRRSPSGSALFVDTTGHGAYLITGAMKADGHLVGGAGCGPTVEAPSTFSRHWRMAPKATSRCSSFGLIIFRGPRRSSPTGAATAPES